MRISPLYKKIKNRCPRCKSILVKAKQERFTNTAEHCLDPNHEYKRPLRDTYICLKCDPYSIKVFWDDMGSAYITGDYKTFRELLPNNSAAIYSWEWFYRKFDVPMTNSKLYKLYMRILLWWRGRIKKDLPFDLQKMYDNKQ